MENRLEDKQARALKTRVRITKTLLSPEIGALIIGMLNNILNLTNVSAYYQTIVKGIVILLAVLLDARSAGKK